MKVTNDNVSDDRMVIKSEAAADIFAHAAKLTAEPIVFAEEDEETN